MPNIIEKQTKNRNQSKREPYHIISYHTNNTNMMSMIAEYLPSCFKIEVKLSYNTYLTVEV